MSMLRGLFVFLVILCLTTTLVVLLANDNHSKVISATEDSLPASYRQSTVSYDQGIPEYHPEKYEFTPEDLHRQFAFSTDSPHDVLVFIHIQKTGGTTFGKNLVTNLDVRNPCQCTKTPASKMRCPCYASDGKKQWLFSRYSTNWICGLHADYTEWSECLYHTPKPDKLEGFHRDRRYLMITMLREPIPRYISEYLHTNRGATWSGATLRCNGKSPSTQHLPFCYQNGSWEGVLLPEFLGCPHNLGNNRQTRMLANLSLVNCYDTTTHDDALRKKIMLRSAIENLTKLPFFGLKEYTNMTEFLFEHTFGVKFKAPLGALVPKTIHDTQMYFDTLKPEFQQQIIEKNELDIKLYAYAKQLFLARYEFAKRLQLNYSKTLLKKMN